MTPAKIPEGSPMTAQGLSAERLAEIEVRHNADQPWFSESNVELGGCYDMANEDRAALLSEVARLRAIADGLAEILRDLDQFTDQYAKQTGGSYSAFRRARAALSTYDSDKAGK